jgi:hypothetical protein
MMMMQRHHLPPQKQKQLLPEGSIDLSNRLVWIPCLLLRVSWGSVALAWLGPCLFDFWGGGGCYLIAP